MNRSLAALLCLVLVACAGGTRAPVESRRGETKVEPARPATHAVVSGDTLYAIAWRYGMDYRTLARGNGIGSPYTIRPGQVLKLDGGAAAAAPAKTRPKQAAVRRSVARPPAPSAKASVPPKAKRGRFAWLWPARGKVVRGFSGTVHKGIDIGGEAGDPVEATAAGTVVYAGSGLVGYGNLLIVKHSEEYLSAYGHNRRLLVREGDAVEAGQRIAEKGSSATDSVKLHFEIRREGKPVDPERLLPPR